MTLILSNIMDQPVYSELRTKAQLGYLVKSYIMSYFSYLTLNKELVKIVGIH